MNESRDSGRLWRRAIGMAAFVLFLGGLLVAIDLEEVVVLAGGLGVLCAAAGLLTLVVARYRGAAVRGTVRAYRVAVPAAARGARWTEATSRSAARRTAPVLRRADDELGAAIKRCARVVAGAAATLLADIHAHREARSVPAPRPRPRAGGRPIPAKSPAARSAARRSAAERRRGRA
jgi:hypothetical protein